MPNLAVSLFGSPLIQREGQPVNGFTYQKARALLVYLLIEAARPHSRDELVGLLWPELPDAAARTNLRQALADLRKVIGDEMADPPFLLVTRDSLQFNPASDYDLDATQFTSLLNACDHHLHRHADRCPTCLARMQQAVATYCGDFLAGFTVNEAAGFEEWLVLKREAFHQRVLTALTHLANAYERRQQCDIAIQYARRQLELDSWREEAHQQLMRLYAATSQRSAALAQYVACRRTLNQELGVEPSAETVALYEAIRAEKRSEGVGEWGGKGVSLLHPLTPSLPHSPTPLLGRETELAELGELLANPRQRLITITGPGGIGKTRLALAAAVQGADTFRHGALFVALDGIASAEFLPQAILTALGIAMQGRESPCQQVRAALQNRELLLVLDNYEQLLPDVTLVTELLRYTPGIAFLVTAREGLALQAEQIFTLEGLAYPAYDAPLSQENFAAVELFLQRVRQRQRHFMPDAGDRAAIGRICQVMEGMPLALELAAAATYTQSCTEIAQALSNGQALPLPRTRDLPQRHHSMEVLFDHSWRLLSIQEQQVLRSLALFRGGFEINAAQAIGGATLDLLGALVDKSLLRTQPPTRFTMHELVRQFAQRQLVAGNGLTRVQRQYLCFFTQLAEEASAQLQGAEQKAWLERLEVEHDNLRAALTWAVAEDIPAALRLVAALGPFWRRRGYLAEGRRWAETALQHADPAMTFYARALMWLGVLTRKQNDFAQGGAYLEQSLALLRAREDEDGVAQALRHLGWYYYHVNSDQSIRCFEESVVIFRQLGNKPRIAQVLTDLSRLLYECTTDYPRATIALEEALTLCRETGDDNGVGHALASLAELSLLQGNYHAAHAQESEALAIFQTVGNQPEIAAILCGLAETSWHCGDYGQARAYAESSLALYITLDPSTKPAISLHHLGLIELLLGELTKAHTHLCQSLRLSQMINNTLLQARCLAGLGGVAVHKGELKRGVYLLAAATSQLAKLPPYLTPADRATYQQFAETARATLPAAVFTAAWTAGSALTLEGAMAYALDD